MAERHGVPRPLAVCHGNLLDGYRLLVRRDLEFHDIRVAVGLTTWQRRKKVVVMFSVLREMRPVHARLGRVFLSSDNGLSRPRPRSKTHAQRPMPMPRSPPPGLWGPGLGTQPRGGARSALDSPSRHRDETSKQIWTDLSRSGLTRKSEVYPNCPAQRERFGYGRGHWTFSGLPVLLHRGHRSSALLSRFRRLSVPRSARARKRAALYGAKYPVGHLALMPRSMTDLTSGGEVADDGVSPGGPGGLEPGKNTLSEEGLVVDKVLIQCGQAGGRHGGIAGRSFEARSQLVADSMHTSTACRVGNALAQSDGRRRPGWRCALTASSTDGTGSLGTGGYWSD